MFYHKSSTQVGKLHQMSTCTPPAMMPESCQPYTWVILIICILQAGTQGPAGSPGSHGDLNTCSLGSKRTSLGLEVVGVPVTCLEWCVIEAPRDVPGCGHYSPWVVTAPKKCFWKVTLKGMLFLRTEHKWPKNGEPWPNVWFLHRIQLLCYRRDNLSPSWGTGDLTPSPGLSSHELYSNARLPQH